MIDSATEVRSAPVGIVSNEQISVLESPPTAIHPDMKGRATPLKDNPVTEQEKESLRKAFGQMGDQDLAERLFADAGINTSVSPKVARNLPQETKNPQGFWLQLKEAMKNFFRNLFR